MIRRALLACAYALAVGMGAQLFVETRNLFRDSRPVAAILAPDEPHPSGVIFVFQPKDCLDSGEMLARWNELHGAGRFPVSGVVTGDGWLSEPQARAFREGGLRLPVRAISPRDAAIVAERLGYETTPFAVILDGQGRVAGSFPANRNVPADVLAAIIHGT